MYQDAGLSEETFNRINNDECLTAWDKYILFSNQAIENLEFANRVLSDFIKASEENHEARTREIVVEELCKKVSDRGSASELVREHLRQLLEAKYEEQTDGSNDGKDA